MERDSDIIEVSADHEESVSADRADLLVAVHGSSLVTGGAILKKAKEVARLVDELQKCGVTEDDIGLEGVHAEVSSGILGRSSSATYRLRVRCNDLSLLPDLLGAVTGAKNASLERVEWLYPDSVQQEAELLKVCAGKAAQKAAAVAASIGARVVGVHRLSERRVQDAPPPMQEGAAAFADEEVFFRARSSKSSRVDLGLDLTHHKMVGIGVRIQYRIEPVGA